jgi:hypothetical protein
MIDPAALPLGMDAEDVIDALALARDNLERFGALLPFAMALGGDEPQMVATLDGPGEAMLGQLYVGLKIAAEEGASGAYVISEGSAAEWPDVLFVFVETRAGGAVRGAARFHWTRTPFVLFGLPVRRGAVAVDPFSWESVARRVFGAEAADADHRPDRQG